MNLSPDVDSFCMVLRTACRIDDAVGGMMHLISEEGCRLVTHYKLPETFLATFRNVEAGDGTTISQACHEIRRVVVRDVREDSAFAPYQTLAAELGIVAVQSTPVNSDTTQMHGVLTTYFARPHHPGPESLQRIDYCASIAAKILVATELEHELGERRVTAGTRAEVAQAASALQMMLPACEREPESELLRATDRELSVVIDDMLERAPKLPSIESTEQIAELHCNL